MAKSSPEHKRLLLAAVISLLLHAVLLSLSVEKSYSKEVRTLEVELIPTPENKAKPKSKRVPQEQLVSPSQSKPLKETVDTPLRSDTNTKVEKQQIRRGQDGSPAKQSTPRKPQKPEPKQAEAEKQPTSEVQRKPSSKASRKTTSNRSATLRLSQDQLAKQLAGIPLAKEPDRAKKLDNRQPERSDAEREAELFARRPFRSSRQSFRPGTPGVPDYLPTIQDGDITLLNTKADKHAVFVRRVALQVFGALRQLNWQELSANEIGRIRQFSTVHAILNPDGSLQRVYLAESSGTKAFDVILQQAAQKGAWDQNPPPAAATPNGSFHFVFLARTWVRPRPDGLGEQRWLLLGTGLR